jgi:hypothetical protein
MPPTYFNNIPFEARSRILRSIAAVYDSPSKKTTVRGDGFTTFLRNERSRPGQLLDSLESLSSEESDNITRIMTFTTKDGSMVFQNFETEVCHVCFVLNLPCVNAIYMSSVQCAACSHKKCLQENHLVTRRLGRY